MRLPLLSSSLLLPFLSLARAAANAPPAFVNTAVARTVELGSLTALVTTQFNVKAAQETPGEYWMALAGAGDAEPAWWEVAVGGKPVEGLLVPNLGAPTVKVPVGLSKKDESATVSLTYFLTHASKPLPAEIAQTEAQFLLWTSNSTYVDSWYPSDVERIKIRTPNSNVLSYSPVPETYTRDSTTTKSSATLTLGPFHSVPATLGGAALQQPFSVHYEVTEPIIGLRKLTRTAEVSHWGANLNIEGELQLVNMGPQLKGHFSRLAHQQSRFHATKPAQLLSELALRVPPSAHSPYYYDTIGNVSTSHFRPGSTTPAANKVRTRASDGFMEMRPRYPLLGGWNYTFVMGYDMPLGDALKSEGEKKVLGVQFLGSNAGMVVDDAELKIILPEGAANIEVHTPFPMDSITHSVHKTYLDSVGRPAVTLHKTRCTPNHEQYVYVTYTYSLGAQLQKPAVVAAVTGGLFLLGMGLRRIDWGIDK